MLSAAAVVAAAAAAAAVAVMEPAPVSPVSVVDWHLHQPALKPYKGNMAAKHVCGFPNWPLAEACFEFNTELQQFEFLNN